MSAPLIFPEKYCGQHAFNVEGVKGWVPEEDLEGLEPINKFKNPGILPKHIYRMTYLKEEKLYSNFGEGNWKAPLIIGREYSFEADDYVMGLSNPQACKIEKAIWNGEKFEDIIWHVLYDETE